MHLNILNRYASACIVCVHVQYRCIPWCEESRNITGRPHTGIHAGIAPCRPPAPLCCQCLVCTYMCCMASSNSTRFIMALISLYESSASSRIFFRDSHDGTARYLGSPIPDAKWQYISGSALRTSWSIS